MTAGEQTFDAGHGGVGTQADLRVDVHQHIWTTPLLDALARRDRLPFVRSENGVTVVHSAGELPYVIDTKSESPAARAALVHADALDRALIALSSPIGIEALPREDADELIAAHLLGVGKLPDEFGAWGPVALDRPDPADVDRLLAGGCFGVSLPATALAHPDALHAIGPVLERVARAGKPVLVHPGAAHSGHEASLTEPLWWRALTDYVAQMQAAWLTFATFGRREHDDLIVVFAMLAGGAPLQHERLATRGGPPIELTDPLVFYDTSSYGPTAVEAMVRTVGAGQLVYGSDRPVAEPVPTGRERLLAVNGGRLL
jgi:hypothetical protein